MLNAILKNLNGHGSEAASLDAALVQLGRDRAEVRERITELKRQKHQLLLDDAPDADLDKVERLIDRAETRLEKLNLAEAPLRERLAAAKGVAFKKATQHHFDQIASAYQKLRDAVLAAEAGQIALMQARDAAVREIGEHAISAFPIFAYGGRLGNGMVRGWATDNDRILERARASRQPRKAAAPKAAALPAAAASTKPPETLQHPITMQGGAITPHMAGKKPEDDLAPLRPGQVRVKVLRAGYSPADDRPQCHYQQVIRMPAKTAEAAAAGGAIEILEWLVPAGAASSKQPNEGATP